jgi:hypothetical protein
VKEQSLSLNTFDLPFKLFEAYHRSANCEVVALHTKDDGKPVSIVFCYKTADNYCPVIIGIDKAVDPILNIYKQTIYQLIKRAIHLKVKNIHLGLTAAESKYMLGADNIKQMGFVQMKDHFNQDFIGSLK